MAETAVAPSMADSIRAAYKEVAEKEPNHEDSAGNAGADGGGGDQNASQSAGEHESRGAEQSAAERARDQAGRFAKAETAADKQRETLTLKPKEAPNAAKEQERKASGQGAAPQAVNPQGGQSVVQGNAQGTQPNGAGQSPSHAGPPPHWNGSAKIDWNKIPGSLRESIAKDYEAVGKAQTLTNVLAPWEQRFTQEFGGTDRALASILSTYQQARQQPGAFARDFIANVSNGRPLDFLRELAQSFGIDPQMIAGIGTPVQAHGQEQPNDPYAQRFQQIETALQQIAQQPVIQAQHQIQSDIQSFQTALKPDGSVEHPYFNDVRAHMAALMRTPGGPATLKEAYDQACWANPNVRAAILKEQEAAKEAERKQAIARAQGAAVSVSGAPGVNGAQPLAAQSVSDTLRNVYRAAKGGRA